MKGGHGRVGADGASAVPGGLYDMAELAQDLTLDPHIEEKLQELFANTVTPEKLKAKYKLELVVGSEGRSAQQPFPGMLMAWTNEGFDHGGGDEVVYFCPKKVDKHGPVAVTCGAPLELEWVSKRVAVCPTCKNAFKPTELTGQIFARLPMQHWATLILRTFEALNFDADLRMKTIKADLRVVAGLEQERNRGGDLLRKARDSQEWVIYPLAHIMKDTSAGADLYERIRAFLAA